MSLIINLWVLLNFYDFAYFAVCSRLNLTPEFVWFITNFKFIDIYFVLFSGQLPNHEHTKYVCTCIAFPGRRGGGRGYFTLKHPWLHGRCNLKFCLRRWFTRQTLSNYTRGDLRIASIKKHRVQVVVTYV